MTPTKHDYCAQLLTVPLLRLIPSRKCCAVGMQCFSRGPKGERFIGVFPSQTDPTLFFPLINVVPLYWIITQPNRTFLNESEVVL